MKIIKGSTLEDQITSIDEILVRFSRKLHKTVVGIITPYNVFNYVNSPSDGIILRHMFHSGGTINSGMLYVENMPKEGVDIVATMYYGNSHKTETLFNKKQFAMLEFNIGVISGFRLEIEIKSRNSGQLGEIWTSFLWTPEIKECVVKQYLIDELGIS
jgi:hypothetical protein